MRWITEDSRGFYGLKRVKSAVSKLLNISFNLEKKKKRDKISIFLGYAKEFLYEIK